MPVSGIPPAQVRTGMESCKSILILYDRAEVGEDFDTSSHLLEQSSIIKVQIKYCQESSHRDILVLMR